jgi:hypothetical protein
MNTDLLLIKTSAKLRAPWQKLDNKISKQTKPCLIL